MLVRVCARLARAAIPAAVGHSLWGRGARAHIAVPDELLSRHQTRHVEQAEGGEQGDPLMPALFCITVLGAPLGSDALVRAQLGRVHTKQLRFLQLRPTLPDLQVAWLLLVLHCASPRSSYANLLVPGILAFWGLTGALSHTGGPGIRGSPVPLRRLVRRRAPRRFGSTTGIARPGIKTAAHTAVECATRAARDTWSKTPTPSTESTVASRSASVAAREMRARHSVPAQVERAY